MSLLRVSTSSLARVSKAPTFVMATRGYADGPTDKAGATASSQGWSKREQVSSTMQSQSLRRKNVVMTDYFFLHRIGYGQAQENQYVQQAEKEKLAKLRESIKKQREHLDEVCRTLAFHKALSKPLDVRKLTIDPFDFIRPAQVESQLNNLDKK